MPMEHSAVGTATIDDAIAKVLLKLPIPNRTNFNETVLIGSYRYTAETGQILLENNNDFILSSL